MPRLSRTKAIKKEKVRGNGARQPQTDVPPQEQLARLTVAESDGEW